MGSESTSRTCRGEGGFVEKSTDSSGVLDSHFPPFFSETLVIVAITLACKRFTVEENASGTSSGLCTTSTARGSTTERGSSRRAGRPIWHRQDFVFCLSQSAINHCSLQLLLFIKAFNETLFFLLRPHIRSHVMVR